MSEARTHSEAHEAHLRHTSLRLREARSEAAHCPHSEAHEGVGIDWGQWHLSSLYMA